MTSELITVLNLWAIVIDVRPSCAASNASCTTCNKFIQIFLHELAVEKSNLEMKFYRIKIINESTFSDSESKADVASSNNKIDGFRISARAIATLCFWPPDNCVPFSPTRVWYP